MHMEINGFLLKTVMQTKVCPLDTGEFTKVTVADALRDWVCQKPCDECSFNRTRSPDGFSICSDGSICLDPERFFRVLEQEGFVRAGQFSDDDGSDAGSVNFDDLI